MKLPSVVRSGPLLLHARDTKWRRRTNTAMPITEAGAKRAETSLFSSRLISTDPIAIPIEKIAMNRLATCSSAPRTFFTSGGEKKISTGPMVQKKVDDRIARNRGGGGRGALTGWRDA